MPFKVICIVGSPHSGVELLDQVFSHIPRVKAVGRVEGAIKFSQIKDDPFYCGCGKNHAGCDYWADVEEQYKKRKMGPGFPNYHRLDLFNAEYNRAFYQSLFEKDHAEIYVESTNNPRRLETLANTEGVALKVIHVIRDGRAVAYEQSLDKKKGLYESMTQWDLTNTKISSILDKYVMPSIQVRYEDLTQETEMEMRRICEFFGFQYQPDYFKARGWVGHNILTRNMVQNAGFQREPNNRYVTNIGKIDWFVLNRKGKKTLAKHKYLNEKAIPRAIKRRLIWG